MDGQKTGLSAKSIRRAYPDCPQREMALGLLREGKVAQAEAWLKTLDQLIRKGQSKFLSGQENTVKRSA